MHKHITTFITNLIEPYWKPCWKPCWKKFVPRDIWLLCSLFSRNVHNLQETFLYIYHNKISHYKCTEFIIILHRIIIHNADMFYPIQVHFNHVEIMLKTVFKNLKAGDIWPLHSLFKYTIFMNFKTDWKNISHYECF